MVDRCKYLQWKQLFKLFWRCVTSWFFRDYFSHKVTAMPMVLSESYLVITRKAGTRAASSAKDKNSLRKIWITLFLSINLAIVVGMTHWRISINIPYLRFLGLSLMVAGLIIRWTAILTLKKYFTVDVHIAGDHKIIQKGIYKIVRHPAYLGSIISFMGLSLVFSSVFALIIINVPIMLIFLHRIKVEEEALILKFGESYIEYSKTAKKLIPKVY
jgi:protein-S-isoprenylcysteine O-methyltransferase Ste14